MSVVRYIPIANIRRRPDARPLADHMVAELAESIAQIGLRNPVTVRLVKDGGYELIAGSHRLAACDSLDHREILAMEITDDDLQAELGMIDENLVRAELSPAERARQTARRKSIYEELHPETRHGAIGGGHDQSRQVGDSAKADRFTSDTAGATGRSERSVQRDAERGEKIAPEVLEMVRGTELDTGTTLDQLKQLPKEEQADAARAGLEERRAPAKSGSGRGGIAGRYSSAPARTQPEQTKAQSQSGPAAFERFVALADEIEAIVVADLIASSGRQRAVLGQRASGLCDRMSEIMEALS